MYASCRGHCMYAPCTYIHVYRCASCNATKLYLFNSTRIESSITPVFNHPQSKSFCSLIGKLVKSYSWGREWKLRAGQKGEVV